MQLSVFHNTTKEEGAALEDASRKAEGQDQLVLDLFVSRAKFNRALAPSTVHKILVQRHALDSHTPLTSVRRAITNLTNRGLLVRTNEKQKGPFGRPEYLWKLSD